ncbi:hypothetical protein KL867_20010 [Ruegeria litorea]|uniref:Uncharacterized protein n=1 Tax=Falsiruegeria litorea TaxID=1280831 RepID=A0ABS5WZV3_9RHOB|nr:hypothetical protein [Falsiruegeria litorea]MBT3143350.1 hypothetical protein [Falsiruegeria litorea]
MENTAQRPLPNLEIEALRAIRAARSFAKNWRKVHPKIKNVSLTQVGDALQRLDDGELFALQDESLWPLMERALVWELNAHRDGYGSHALEKDTSHDQLLDPELDDKRWLMECWKAFKSSRQNLIDRRKAARLAEFFSQ